MFRKAQAIRLAGIRDWVWASKWTVQGPPPTDGTMTPITDSTARRLMRDDVTMDDGEGNCTEVDGEPPAADLRTQLRGR